MIEAKDDKGKTVAKIAEDENEEFWTQIKKSAEEEIKNVSRVLKFQKAVLELANEKLKEYNKP